MPESFEAFQMNHQPAQITENHEKDQPVEQDACHSHFVFVQDSTVSTDLQLGLKYQWFIGERPLSIFVAISGVTSEVTDSSYIFFAVWTLGGKYCFSSLFSYVDDTL